MATPITVRNPETNLTATVYRGFSWTTLFFGPFPALFRSDFVTFLIICAVEIILAFASFGIGNWIFGFAWAFFYNGYHARSLVSKGYMVESDIVKKQEVQTETASKHNAELADAVARGVALALAQREGR
jgi:hypothetical protein